jgi:glycosyltransferase involved in cell wall biosynthesis
MIKQNKPLVTIAIPTYNRADGYLKHALKSVLKQTYENIEIVVSDNCSTDNTAIFVKGCNDSRIRYFRQKENLEPNDNFNFCLNQAKGVYFLLLHDDDMIDSDFVETCMKNVNNYDIGIIRTGMRRINSAGKLIRECPNFVGGLSTEEFFMAWVREKTPMHLCMSLFNTNKLKQIGGFNSKHNLFQDVLAEVILAAKFGRVDIEDTKASYRMHDAQFSGSAKMRRWCEESFFLFDAMCDLLPAKKALFRKRGKAFFFRHNYGIAKKIISPTDRFISYLIVFKSFGYLYSIRYRFRCIFSPIFYKLRSIKVKMKQLLFSGAGYK